MQPIIVLVTLIFKLLTVNVINGMIYEKMKQNHVTLQTNQ
jgi:hypothetical protein